MAGGAHLRGLVEGGLAPLVDEEVDEFARAAPVVIGIDDEVSGVGIGRDVCCEAREDRGVVGGGAGVVVGIHHAVAEVAGDALEVDALELRAVGGGGAAPEPASGGVAADAGVAPALRVLVGDGDGGPEERVAGGLSHDAGVPGAVGLGDGVEVAVAEGALVGVDQLDVELIGLGAGPEEVIEVGGQTGDGDRGGTGGDSKACRPEHLGTGNERTTGFRHLLIPLRTVASDRVGRTHTRDETGPANSPSARANGSDRAVGLPLETPNTVSQIRVQNNLDRCVFGIGRSRGRAGCVDHPSARA